MREPRAFIMAVTCTAFALFGAGIGSRYMILPDIEGDGDGSLAFLFMWFCCGVGIVVSSALDRHLWSKIWKD